MGIFLLFIAEDKAPSAHPHPACDPAMEWSHPHAAQTRQAWPRARGSASLCSHTPPCLRPQCRLPESRRRLQPGAGTNQSLNLHGILLQRMNEGFPLRRVKTLIDVDLIPNLFRGVLIVILLIPGHSLRRETGHLREGWAKVQILARWRWATTSCPGGSASSPQKQ